MTLTFERLTYEGLMRLMYPKEGCSYQAKSKAFRNTRAMTM